MNETFQEVLTAAVRDITERGYRSPEQIDEWIKRLRLAAIAKLPAATSDNQLRAALRAALKRGVSKTAVMKNHPGVDHFTVRNIEPQFRAILDRRILAATDLIKLNRDQAVETTLRRFSGWATSIPDGGSRVVDRQEVKEHIAKPLRSQTYEERRLAIDQGHKLLSSVNAVIAEQSGAIAGVWRSNWRQPGYDYRPDHKERDQRVYLIRGSWAHQQGLVKAGRAGYLDEITQAAEEPFCRCWVRYVTTLRDVPADMLTEKGKKTLERVRL